MVGLNFQVRNNTRSSDQLIAQVLDVEQHNMSFTPGNVLRCDVPVQLDNLEIEDVSVDLDINLPAVTRKCFPCTP